MLMLMLNLQRLWQHAQNLHEFKPHKIPTWGIINWNISYWKSHIQLRRCLQLLPTGKGKVSYFFGGGGSDTGYVNQTLELIPKLKVLSLSSERDPEIFVHSCFVVFCLFICFDSSVVIFFLREREVYELCG